jgi:hypothetical protein
MSRAASPLTPDFLEESVTVRGATFRLRELSIGEYDELVRKSTTKVQNPVTGEEVETIDNALLLKLMVLKCSVDPKLTAETLAGLPMRVVLKLNQTVNRMHYGDEPESEKAPDAEEETPKGNA